MPSYSYSAVNENGRTMKGTILAENEVDLEARLRDLGLDLISYRVVKEKTASFLSKVQLKDKIILCLHLEQLDRAGVPLHDALADLRDSTESAKLRDVMTDICESVKGGMLLSEAMAKYPEIFSEVFVGLVHAGEKTGNLAESFAHMSNHLKWTAELRRKVRKAIAYPAVLLVVMSAVIAILMLFVVPKLIDFIVNQGFDIPPHTQLLIWVSGAFQDYWYLIFGVPTGLTVMLTMLYKVSDGFAYWFDSMVLRIPVIGNTVRKINLARFTHFFAVMFRSGIDILDSLGAAREVVNNRVLRESVATVKRSVTEGNSLTASLRISSQFPSLVIRMFKVGEESGNMNEALENINFFYNREVSDAVDAMVGMIQPTLTIVMGGVIFWVVAAVFGPLYESFQNLNI